MGRFSVLLHGTGVAMQADASAPKREHGFYVSCTVVAPDAAKAAELAVTELQRHPTYLGLEPWAPSAPTQRPRVVVDSVARVPFWRRVPEGISAGFTFYASETRMPASAQSS